VTSRMVIYAMPVAAIGLACVSAEAKPARCFTTDDGYFPCEFTVTDDAGSFEISGEDVHYSLIIDEPGVAYGFLNLGVGNVALPGRYVRSNEDRVCWENAETETKICAW
jgi:hypothetical protein